LKKPPVKTGRLINPTSWKHWKRPVKKRNHTAMTEFNNRHDFGQDLGSLLSRMKNKQDFNTILPKTPNKTSQDLDAHPAN